MSEFVGMGMAWSMQYDIQEGNKSRDFTGPIIVFEIEVALLCALYWELRRQGR